MAAAESKIYRLEDVARHGTAQDCWIVVSGKVFEVTSFLTEHPGGPDVLKSAAGRDATAEFEDAGHGPDARELMNKFCVGMIDPTAPAKDPIRPILAKSTQSPQEATADFVTKMLPFIVPVIILSVSFVIRYFNNN